jgi:hypothetical protein
MIEGAVIAVVALLIGRFLPARRRAPKAPKPIEPVCGCGHHHAMHDADGTCNQIDVHTVTVSEVALTGDGKPIYDSWNEPVKNEHVVETAKVPCQCRRYSGPEPLPPQYFAPEVSS